MKADFVPTIIIGGGQAGLALSYYLTRQGYDHLILEQAQQPAEAWRHHRWDSFTLVTPNWQITLPGAEYHGPDPDGFLPVKDIVMYFEQYINLFRLPVHYGVRVTAVEQAATGYQLQTEKRVFRAANVVIATGFYQSPKIPPYSAHLPGDVLQLPADQYRNPQALPAGAVLVVGTGQTGCQIAEELYRSGRKVYLSVGSTGRVPRRYRGKDILRWLYDSGFFSRTVDQLPSPKIKFNSAPHASGTRGGHTINLHQFARDGVVLLGHIQAIEGSKIQLAPDLKNSLAKVDQFEADVLKGIDDYIARQGIDAPVEKIPELRDGYAAEEILQLDLREQGITSVIWACGFSFDYSLVKLPVLDADGYPIQKRGVTQFPGLYFLGLPWLHTLKSGFLFGVGEDAAYLSFVITGKNGKP
ncbi:MAG: NAD(P)-binding domain-containing protein [Chloroflexi bacterium]|nr:NAD(P)-binding domain-containing protein [Chloroflexota bacterium]